MWYNKCIRNCYKYNYEFGFVRDKNNELYLNNTEYVENMSDDRWVLIEDVF